MDFVKLEQQVLAFWRAHHTFKQSLQKNAKGRPFVFYEGPPSANAKPGIHHVLARAFKDLIPRFKTMQGNFVARKAGWDTHGLPIEVQAEKELGLKSKKDIESYGVAKFNAYCRQLVFRYQKDWEQLTERIGFWIDLERPYITYENDYIEKLWGIIKQFHDNGLLYKGHKVLPHCPRCGTSLSSHEVAQGYEEVSEPAIYVKFKLLQGAYKDNYILAWTTTPWTLPGNVALAVGQKIPYVRAKLDGQWLIFAKGLIKAAKTEPIETKKLIGSSYQPLYRLIGSKAKDLHTVLGADFVSTQEGTGVVHTAVMYGEEDYELGQKYHLPKIHTVAEDGTFKDFVKPFAGQFVKDADKAIIKDLEDRGLLYKKENYTHSYPFCWRCETPLLYYAKDSWFVAMSKLRDQLLKNNAAIQWLPNHLREGRFGEFLKEVKDWAFSRERYWGTPLPVWTCESGHHKVIGSVNELPQKLKDLHRPFIDEVILQCEKCNKKMHREPYVVDVWFDSGAMPYASGDKAAGRFPADFIAEAIDQTRGWFYTLLAVSTALGDPSPYRSVISTGHVLDAKGQKMSKSKGNVIDPDEVIKKHGADALRWYFYAMNQPGDNKAFIEKDLNTYKNKTLGLLWNVYNYYETYKNQNSKVKNQNENAKFKILDNWITVRLHQTINQVTKNLEDYRITEAARTIMVLIDDLSTWYLRRSRGRTDQRFFATLKSVLLTIAKLIAPFMPFNAEALYQKFDQGSVHLQDWPKPERAKIRDELIAMMAKTRAIVSLTLELRSKKEIKIRQPLSTLTIPEKLPAEFLDLIADEVNVKKVKSGNALALDTKMTPELEREGDLREVIRSLQQLRKQAGYRLDEQVRAYYEADSRIEAAISFDVRFVESATNTIILKGIPEQFDKLLKTDRFRLAIKRK